MRASRFWSRPASTELVHQMLRVFGLAADVDLDVMTHGQRLADLTGVLTQRLGSLVDEVATGLGCRPGRHDERARAALAGFYDGVPVAHVEAGLRRATCARRSPRKSTVVSSPCSRSCTARRHAVENLLAEGVEADRIHLTGTRSSTRRCGRPSG